jgi:hypothetical protein
VVVVKGGTFRPVEELIAPSRATVEVDMNMDYRLGDFSQGVKALGAQLELDLKANPPTGCYWAPASALEKEVLSALIACADLVLRRA